jgi:hypothetical protein
LRFTWVLPPLAAWRMVVNHGGGFSFGVCMLEESVKNYQN